MKKIAGFGISIVALRNVKFINFIIQHNFFSGNYLVYEENNEKEYYVILLASLN